MTARPLFHCLQRHSPTLGHVLVLFTPVHEGEHLVITITTHIPVVAVVFGLVAVPLLVEAVAAVLEEVALGVVLGV